MVERAQSWEDNDMTKRISYIYILQVAKVTVPFLTITITEGGLVPKVFMEIEPYWLLVVKPACPPTAKIPLDWM